MKAAAKKNELVHLKRFVTSTFKVTELPGEFSVGEKIFKNEIE